MAKGILIVPGSHASLDNINAAGEWVEDEVFTYLGQTRKHQKGSKAGRVMGAWRKLRETHPHLLRHFSVYSQPASNMDGIIMSWVIKAMSKQHPLALHQRDCFSAAFSPEVMNMQYLAHEEEMCRSEYGPGATEHPSAAASAWHIRLAKLTQALQIEYEKVKIEIVSEHQKLELQGEKLHKERMKQYELAKKRMSQGHELTALMEEAYKQIHESKRTLFFTQQVMAVIYHLE